MNIKPRINIFLPFILFVILGAILLGSFYDYPIVRNSLIYAAIIQGISESSLWQAVEFAQNKPLGFAILSWPISDFFGENLGLKISSWLWTACFGLMAIFFMQYLASQVYSTNKQQIKQQLFTAIFICLFNPLILYQFISAYPDTLFATLFLAAILSFERVLAKDGHWLFGLLASTLVFLSIWIKHHGFILIPLFIVMAIYQYASLREQWQMQSKRIKFSIICFLILFALLNDAQQGELTLFNMSQNHNNFLGGENRFSIIAANLENLLIFSLLCFSSLLPILFYFPAYKHQAYFVIPLLLVFILPILYYKGAQYNIRYFIAIIPILAWIIAGQIQQWPHKLRYIGLSLFILCNTFSITYYHHLTFNQWVQKIISLPKIDNLRLISEQYVEKQNLTLIKRYAETHNKTLLYFSDYYKQGTYGVWQKAGLLPKDLQIHYFMQWPVDYFEHHPIEKAIVYEYIGVGAPMNTMPNNSQLTPYLTKLSKQLYLFDSTHKLSL